MFGYGYKEDALKWRAQKLEEEKEQKSRLFKMIIEVVLKDGNTEYKTLTSRGISRDIGLWQPQYAVFTGDKILDELYNGAKELAGTKGLEVDSGIFIPHSNIHHIRNTGIEEVRE